MKKLLIIAGVINLSFCGCRSVNRLIDGSSDESVKPASPVTNGLLPISSTPPDFGLPIPQGFNRVVYWGALPANGIIQVKPGFQVQVFEQQRLVPGWKILSPIEIQAFWYDFNSVTGIVTYHGNTSFVEYCIYQYEPKI